MDAEIFIASRAYNKIYKRENRVPVARQSNTARGLLRRPYIFLFCVCRLNGRYIAPMELFMMGKRPRAALPPRGAHLKARLHGATIITPLRGLLAPTALIAA